MTIGGVVGGYIPMLWGDSGFSLASVFFSGVGGFVGIWLGYKLGNI